MLKETVTQAKESLAGMMPTSHAEGRVARAIEEQTAKLPSDVFLWAATASMVGSFVFAMARQRHASLFVGQWVPTLLILGLYNKLVKVEGHDRIS